MNNLEGEDVRNCYLGGLMMGLGFGGFLNIKSSIGRAMAAIGFFAGGLTNGTTNPTSCGL
jgi:hypothetical protein